MPLCGELLLACRLNMLHLIHRLAEPRELLVHLSPGAVRVSQWPMLWQAMPRVVAENICECELLVGGELLYWQPQPRRRDVRGKLLRPLDRGILDRHQERVGLHLHHEIELPLP